MIALSKKTAPVGNDATQQLIQILFDPDKYMGYLQTIAKKEDGLRAEQERFAQNQKEFLSAKKDIDEERAKLEREKVAFQEGIVNLKLELEAKRDRLDNEISEKLQELSRLERLRDDIQKDQAIVDSKRNGLRQKEAELTRREHDLRLAESEVKNDKADISKAKQLLSQLSS